VNINPADKVIDNKSASAQAHSKSMFPKPLGVMTYAEMSSEIACLYFKKTMLTAEVQRLAKENILLKQKEKARALLEAQERQIYKDKIVELRAELKRVQQFAGNLVDTI